MTSMAMSELSGDMSNGFSLPELKLVLLGNIGCGKTSSADTILSQLSPVSQSAARSCQLRQGVIDGRKVTLVEAPRWYWNGSNMEESVRRETQRVTTLLAPSLHAVLLLVPVGQFTEMEAQVPSELQELFGGNVLDHTLVLLTCGDYLMGLTAEEYLQKEHPGLRRLIERCGGRYHAINNRRRQDREQVYELLKKVDILVQENGMYSIKTPQEAELEKRVNERKRELMECFRAQKEERRQASSKTQVELSVEVEGEEARCIDRAPETEADAVTEGQDASPVSQVLSSVPLPEQQINSDKSEDAQGKLIPRFRLSPDGAILSQMSEEKLAQKIVTTHHHSFENRSPVGSPEVSFSSPISSFSLPTTASSSLTSSSSPELRLVLLGRSGAGKSTVGNAILGHDGFASWPDSLTAITQECEKKKALVAGRTVAVVDTPDWFNSERSPDEVRAQISSCVALSSPGPHAFLLCVPTDQPAKMELRGLCALESVFGTDAVRKHTLVVFTYVDQLMESGKVENDDVESYIAGRSSDLLKLVERCGDRYHVMEYEDEETVAELLEKVEQTVKEAGVQYYSSPAFQEAENRVRQRQVEIKRERRSQKLQEPAKPLGPNRQGLYPSMQTVAEAEEEVQDSDSEETRDEAEISVSNVDNESLPPVTFSSPSFSLLHSMQERMQSGAKMLPKLLASSSEWLGEGAKSIMSHPVLGSLGKKAQNVPATASGSEESGSTQAMGKDRQLVAEDGAAVSSGIKTAAAPVWEKVGSGARFVADRSRVIGAGIGAGAKNVAQSPMWGKVGTGAKSGAKLIAESSMQVGAGIGAGAKKVAQSPVWEKVGSGAKTGAKMVADSPVWQKLGEKAKEVPKVVIGGAVLGLVLGVFLGGMIGGAIGAGAGAAVSDVARRKFVQRGQTDSAHSVEQNVQRAVTSPGKVLKNE